MDVILRNSRLKFSPEVSASLIAQYIRASPTRRKSIIRAAHFPKPPVIAQYDIAREGLVKFLTDETRNYKHLANVKDRLREREERPESSDWEKSDSRRSIEAIETFENSYNQLGFPKLQFSSPGRLPLLDLWPTKIKVELDAIVRKPSKLGPGPFGGMILLFSKTRQAPEARIDQCRTIAGLIYIFCERYLAHLGTPNRSLCLAVDIFAERAVPAPEGFVQKLDYIEDACEEIAARWDEVTPLEDEA
jgi:hypothetical protein